MPCKDFRSNESNNKSPQILKIHIICLDGRKIYEDKWGEKGKNYLITPPTKKIKTEDWYAQETIYIYCDIHALSPYKAQVVIELL